MSTREGPPSARTRNLAHRRGLGEEGNRGRAGGAGQGEGRNSEEADARQGGTAGTIRSSKRTAPQSAETPRSASKAKRPRLRNTPPSPAQERSSPVRPLRLASHMTTPDAPRQQVPHQTGRRMKAADFFSPETEERESPEISRERGETERRERDGGE